MRYLITALLLLLCATSAQAGVFVGFGAQSGGCSEQIAASGERGGFIEVFGASQYGSTFSAAAGDVICGVQLYVYSVPDPPKTITVRVGPSSDLSATYAQGTLEVDAGDVGTWVIVPLATTVTGSTTYYFAASNAGTNYGGRVGIDSTNTGGYETYDGDWVLDAALANPAPVYRIMGQ